MTRWRLSRPVFWMLVAIVAIAAVVRFWALGFGLPHTQARPDETVIIDAARDLLAGRLPRFYDYPWLYIWLVTLAYIGYFVWGLIGGTFQTMADMLASWPVHWEPFFLIPRVITAIFGTATVLVVFRLGRQLRDEATGLVAALFLALAFMHVRNSHFGTTDITMTFFIVLALSLLVDAHRTGRRAAFVLAGAAAGLAAATKYNAALLAAPVAASLVLALISSRREDRRRVLVDYLVAFGLPFVVMLAIGVPFVVLDRERFLIAMGELQHALAVGDPRLDLSNGWLLHLEYSLRYGIGWPMLAAGVAGAALIIATRPRDAALFLSFPLAYYAVAGSINLLFFRYVMPVVPFLCLTAAYAVVAAVAAARLRSPRAAPAVIVGLAALVVWPSAQSTLGFDRIMAQTDSRVLVARWFTSHVPAGSVVVQSGGRYGHVQFDREMAYKVWQWDGSRGAFMLDGKRATGLPDAIVVQESPLPSTTQQQIKDLLQSGYTRVADFHALTFSDDLVYDRLDQFYVPFSGFADVKRPGPNFSVYQRTEVALR